ncbi:hypothetical protein TeGR_g1717, partial [Tetraparma gracilis]
MGLALDAPSFELLSGFLVIVTCSAYALGTIPTLPDPLPSTLLELETAISVFFGVEYALRLAASPRPLKTALAPQSLVDLLTFLPSLLLSLNSSLVTSLLLKLGGLSSLEAFSSLRLFRILRLQRFLVDFETFRSLEQALGFKERDITMVQLQIVRVASSLLTLLYISTGLIYATEHAANPEIPDFF